MSELGRLLAEARDARSLSLADGEAATRIRQKYLQALEDGAFTALPRGAVARGFVRSYARFLGLDVAETEQRYRQESGDSSDDIPMADPGKPRQVDYRPVEVTLFDSRPHIPWLTLALGLLVVAVVAGVIWLAVSGAGANLLAALGPARQPTPTASPMPAAPTAVAPTAVVTLPSAPTALAPQATPTSDLLTLPTPTVPPTVTPTPRPTATPETVRLSLTVRTTQRSWLRITVDGALATEDTLEAGQMRTWEGRQSVAVRTGNAGGVNLILNSQELGAMGPLGAVVERIWTLADGKVTEVISGTVTATPRPSATPTG